MSIELGFLETRVARRLFLRFLLCAVVPISVLAGLSYAKVTANLRERGDLRIQEVARATEQSVHDRLDQARENLALLVSVVETDAMLEPNLPQAAPFLASSDSSAPVEHVRTVLAGLPKPTGFSALMVRAPGGGTAMAFGEASDLSALDETHREHLADGRTLLVQAPDDPQQIWMGHALRLPDGTSSVVWAQLDPAHLWRASAVLAALPDVGATWILNSAFAALNGPPLADAAFIDGVESAAANEAPTFFGWESEHDGSFRSAIRPIHLAETYRSQDWHVVVNVPERAVMAPLRGLAGAFPLWALLALSGVALFGFTHIRRTIRPVQRLRDAIHRIASHQFDTQIEISDADEFRDLTTSFNGMVRDLEQKFDTLSAMRQLDRVGLAATSREEVVDTLLQTLLAVQDCDAVSVCTFGSAHGDETVSRAVVRVGREVNIVHRFECGPRELEDFRGQTHVLIDVTTREELPCFLRVPPFNDLDHKRFLVVPVEAKDLKRGLICFASTNPSAFSEADIRRARDLTAQAALAFSNVVRMEELSNLNIGALSALARTIDASSPWTAGHSERVTRVAVALGRTLGLDDQQMDTLRRGGLLHDIGKIGVPVEILNKPGGLTHEEFARVKEHPVVGARILEPIATYSDLLPIVLSHHERMDGNGYPHGLAGEEIPYLARIMAVADTFEALTSDRPYRQGLPYRTAVEVVRNAAGSQLDENVVNAFLRLVEEDSLELELMGDSPEPIDHVWDEYDPDEEHDPLIEDDHRDESIEQNEPVPAGSRQEAARVRLGPKVGATL